MVQALSPIFDEDDLRLTETQKQNHFCEWFAAIHLHCHGAYSLVEKYTFESHPKKKPIFEKELDAQARNVLADICDRFGVQGPDLLAYKPGEHYWFAEVKGPGDRLAENQRQSHTAIRRQLGVEVELISVRIQR